MKKKDNHPRRFDYACIITAYKNAAIAEPLVLSLLQQSYSNFTIYLVADECEAHQFQTRDERFVLLKPEEPLRLKAKSILYATRHFKHTHDYIVIFDADNLAHPDFLEKINAYASVGFKSIQGRRTAKNLDTNYAALDSLGEHYKNYLERQAPFMLGGSAVISGSGMATETALYKAYLNSREIQEGQHQWKKMLQEDKILQNFILRQGDRIAYAREAVVYDEKVSDARAVETQRSRWLYSYFQNIPNALGLLVRGILYLNINQLYFGWVTIVLPMFLQIGLALVLALAGIWLSPAWTAAMLAGLSIFALGVLWALHLDGAPVAVWKVVLKTPLFILRQCIGLLKMGNPNKHFKHTEHHKKMTVEETMKQKNSN
ncbi:MAG: glycosyltransferase [Saprospiraceae bacterium]|nr:glycosyltransferase [Saprospiraceae bacterium]